MTEALAAVKQCGVSASEPAPVQQSRTVVGSPPPETPAEDEAPQFVVTRPSRIDFQQRRAGANDKVYDFAKFKHQLPIVEAPAPGYCFSSILYPAGLPNVSVRVIWDGGAEGTSISDY